jgi:hypothetical protein
LAFISQFSQFTHLAQIALTAEQEFLILISGSQEQGGRQLDMTAVVGPRDRGVNPFQVVLWEVQAHVQFGVGGDADGRDG